GILLRWLGYPHARLFHRLHGKESLVLEEPAATRGNEVVRFESTGQRWDGEKLERLRRAANARWVVWGPGDAPAPPPFHQLQTLAVSGQPYFRAWKPMMLFTAPFRTLQPGEFSRVMAPIAPAILVDRKKLLALGIPRIPLAATAWMLLFWKAAAAGWHSYSAGQDRPLKEQPDLPMQETAFLLNLFRARTLRRLGPRDPDLARGCIAAARPSSVGDPGRLKVLLVTPFLPYPLSHGGAVRIYNLCRALADRVDFTLVAIREKEDAVDYDK